MAREQKQYGKSDTKIRVEKLGKQIKAAMSPEELEYLGSKWNTLHFKELYGLNSIQTTRNEGGTDMKPVAILLETDIDIDDVPVIDVTIDKDTGINLETDIGSRQVKAGEEFCLSYYEFMFLVIRDEYAAFVNYGGYKAVCLSVKTAVKFDEQDGKSYEFLEIDEDLNYRLLEVEDSPGRVRLPIPTITFVQGKDENGNGFNFGAIRDHLEAIDEKTNDGKWKIKEKYAKEKDISRFQALIDKHTN
ncbi:hypothetical protein [Paenibacillus sp. DMB5]|uniref:hypothetical protein n=1 Tax=Paenibacillus sp. DMB5 TaxID=1780103 RepID=UPI00076BE5CB|nr:hypothetical protein [Paenibacillus sp. DMB5]KUP22083.1 hypothetical protein AWJ19_21480 [Paenibacillus sp. DMB5]